MKVLDVSIGDKRISLSIRELLEKEDTSDEDFQNYEASKKDEPSGFSLGDMIGDQLKNIKTNE